MIVHRQDGIDVAVLDPPPEGFPRHFHDEYVVSVNVRGSESVWLDGACFHVAQDSVTLYNPGQLQSSTGSAGWRCVSAYLQPAWIAERFQAKLHFANPCCNFDQAVTVARSLMGASSLDADLVEEACVLLLSLVAAQGACAGRLERDLAPRDPRLTRVMQRLRDDLVDVQPLSALAIEAGVSVEHLVRSFSRAFGMPPKAWRMQLRMIEARRRLRGGASIPDIALELGFADQSHFHKAFRRSSGMTPARFRSR